MIISEEDIFAYVYAPKMLDENKIKYLLENYCKFGEFIDLLCTLEDGISEKDETDLVIKLRKRMGKNFLRNCSHGNLF